MTRSVEVNRRSLWSNTARLCVLFFLLLVVSVATSESVSIITLDITDGGTASTYLFHQTSSSTSALLTTDGLKELLSNPFTATTLTVTTAGAQQQMESTMAATPIGFFTGGIPNTLANVNGMLLVDPINLTSGLHQSNNNFIYLFAVLEQQLYMAAYYCKNEHINAADIRVLIRSSSNSGAISAAAKAAFAYYGIALPSSSLVASSATITDELLTSGFTFVVGLATSDVAPLVSFLDTQTAATVMVDFDDLTLLYDTFVASFGTVVKPSMSRLLYATNLPRWSTSSGSASSSDSVLKAFQTSMPAAYHTPAGMRAFYSVLFINAVAAKGFTSTAALEQALYQATEFSVGDVSFGPYSTKCIAPSQSPLLCIVNYDSHGLSLWSYSSAVDAGTGVVVGATTTPMGSDADGILDDRANAGMNDPLKGILIVGAVMCHLMFLLVLRVYFGCLWFIPLPRGDDSESSTAGTPTAATELVGKKNQLLALSPNACVTYICVDLTNTQAFFHHAAATMDCVVDEWHRTVSIVAEGFGVSLVHAQQCRFIFSDVNATKAQRFAVRLHHEMLENAFEKGELLYALIDEYGLHHPQHHHSHVLHRPAALGGSKGTSSAGVEDPVRLYTEISIRQGPYDCTTVATLPVEQSWNCCMH